MREENERQRNAMRKRNVEQSLGIYFKHVCFLKKIELEVMPRVQSFRHWKLRDTKFYEGKMNFGWKDEFLKGRGMLIHFTICNIQVNPQFKGGWLHIFLLAFVNHEVHSASLAVS